MGRPDHGDGRHSADDVTRESTGPVGVYIHVTRTTGHWLIIWRLERNSWNTSHIDTVFLRRLHVFQETDIVGNRLGHLTNYGPYSAAVQPTGHTMRAHKVLIKVMTPDERKTLEDIASKVGVMQFPDGEWSCRSWVLEVLTLAGPGPGKGNILTKDEIEQAITAADVYRIIDKERE